MKVDYFSTNLSDGQCRRGASGRKSRREKEALRGRSGRALALFGRQVVDELFEPGLEPLALDRVHAWGLEREANLADRERQIADLTVVIGHVVVRVADVAF